MVIMTEAEGIAEFARQLANNIISPGIVQTKMINVVIDILQNELKDDILEIAEEELEENWSPLQ